MGLFCPLAPDWGVIGTWVGAIGALLVGGSAIYIAVIANRINHRAVDAEAARTHALRKAIGAILGPELKSTAKELEHLSVNLRANADGGGPTIRQLRKQWESDRMPRCLASVQELGNLPPATAQLVGQVVGLVTTTLPQILRILDEDYSGDMQDELGALARSPQLTRKFSGKCGEASLFARHLSATANEAWACLLGDREPPVGFVQDSMREMALN